MFKVSRHFFGHSIFSSNNNLKNVFHDQIVVVVICLTALTANVIAAPQLGRIVQDAFVAGIERAAEDIVGQNQGYRGNNFGGNNGGGFGGNNYGGFGGNNYGGYGGNGYGNGRDYY